MTPVSATPVKVKSMCFTGRWSPDMRFRSIGHDDMLDWRRWCITSSVIDSRLDPAISRSDPIHLVSFHPHAHRDGSPHESQTGF